MSFLESYENEIKSLVSSNKSSKKSIESLKNELLQFEKDSEQFKSTERCLKVHEKELKNDEAKLNAYTAEIEIIKKMKNYKSFSSHFQMCKEFISTYKWDEYEHKIEEKTPNTKQLPYGMFEHLKSDWYPYPLEEHYEEDEIILIAHFLKVYEMTLETMKDEDDYRTEFAKHWKNRYIFG